MYVSVGLRGNSTNERRHVIQGRIKALSMLIKRGKNTIRARVNLGCAPVSMGLR
jgi:hypothetical protein